MKIQIRQYILARTKRNLGKIWLRPNLQYDYARQFYDNGWNYDYSSNFS